MNRAIGQLSMVVYDCIDVGPCSNNVCYDCKSRVEQLDTE